MTIPEANVSINNSGDSIVIKDPSNALNALHKSQLNFWGFRRVIAEELSAFAGPKDLTTIVKAMDYFRREGISTVLDADLEQRLDTYFGAARTLQNAQELGSAFKNGALDERSFYEFQQELSTHLKRHLKNHQLKAAYHLYQVVNSADFSVPGSGKTSVVLAVYDMLYRRGEVNLLFVVGPPSCFAPWRAEYELTLGKEPKWDILAGGDKNTRKSKYSSPSTVLKDLYLTTFQSLLSDKKEIAQFLNQRGVSAFLVIDEAHYIKQLDGSWASAALGLASYAKRRAILTGTPIPRSYTDTFNLFDFLWPGFSPLSQEDKIKIRVAEDSGDHALACTTLNNDIGSLFYRVRKSELGLMPAKFHSPILIEMNKYERLVYDAIENRIRSYAFQDYLRNVDFVRKLQKGRMMRLRQSLSNVALLRTALHGYRENLITEKSIAYVVDNYGTLEIPAKVEYLLKSVSLLTSQGEKAIVWTNFIGTLKLLHRHFQGLGIGAKMIFGETPVEKATVRDAETREQIIKEFKDEQSGLQVLLLNPAACAESISLHTNCRHAVYYDLSYNLAQYLQSLDRIHRVGGSETRQANYYFLQYINTIDSDIYDILDEKAKRMYAIIERDYAIYSLDMFEDDGDIAAYERIFTEA